MNNTTIEWTNVSWNPVVGCTKVSQGCKNCYAETMHERFNGKGSFRNINMKPDKLHEPLKWKGPKRCFVNSMSDLFHEDVPFEFIDKVHAVMAIADNITFQVLTKRAQRMKQYYTTPGRTEAIQREMSAIMHQYPKYYKRVMTAAMKLIESPMQLTIQNLWLGVSVENQDAANGRIPELLQCPAGVRWVSCEPLLGPVILFGEIDWVVVGGESGPKARPMHPEWVKLLHEHCKAANVPFFFKQWGEWYTRHYKMGNPPKPTFIMWRDYQHFTQKLWATKGDACLDRNGKLCEIGGDFMTATYPVVIMQRVGKKAAGRQLDGVEYSEYPKTV